MKRTAQACDAIGIAANQIAVPLNIILATLPVSKPTTNGYHGPNGRLCSSAAAANSTSYAPSAQQKPVHDGDAYGDASGGRTRAATPTQRKTPAQEQTKLVMFNVKISPAARSSLIFNTESCLSVPGYTGVVQRPASIIVDFQDELGHPRRLRAEGFASAIMQHEADHVKGITYPDVLRDRKFLFHQSQYAALHNALHTLNDQVDTPALAAVSALHDLSLFARQGRAKQRDAPALAAARTHALNTLRTVGASSSPSCNATDDNMVDDTHAQGMQPTGTAPCDVPPSMVCDPTFQPLEGLLAAHPAPHAVLDAIMFNRSESFTKWNRSRYRWTSMIRGRSHEMGFLHSLEPLFRLIGC